MILYNLILLLLLLLLLFITAIYSYALLIGQPTMTINYNTDDRTPYNDIYGDYGELTGEEVAFCETLIRRYTLSQARNIAKDNSLICHNF